MQPVPGHAGAPAAQGAVSAGTHRADEHDDLYHVHDHGPTVRWNPDHPAIDRVERKILGLDELRSTKSKWVKAISMLLGDAPIELLSPLIKKHLPVPDGHNALAITGGMGLAVDGVVRGLFWSNGLLRGPVEKAAPVLFRSNKTGRFSNILRGLKSGRDWLRYGGYGISIALGGIRAYRAIAQQGSFEALLTTTDGRSGALHAIGGALLMVPHPVTRLAGAAAYAGAVVNDWFTDDEVVPTSHEQDDIASARDRSEHGSLGN